MLSSNVSILTHLINFLESACANPSSYRSIPRAFTRNRKLGFSRLVVLILSQVRKSISVELYEFFDRLGHLEDLCSKSAFTQARYKLKACFFVQWNGHLLRHFYQSDGVVRWHGWRLIAVDGSQLRLPRKAALYEHFGRLKADAVPLAQVICCYDLLNQLSIHAQLAPCRKCETKLLLSWLESLQPDMLLIADRLYATFELMYRLTQANRAFVMRISERFTFVKAFVQSGKKTQVCQVQISAPARKNLLEQGYQLPKQKQMIKLRLIRIDLPSGKSQILVSSLLDLESCSLKQFAKLYYKRWGVETFYDRIKNQFCVQLFSGIAPQAIYQDFFAAILLHNIHSLIIAQAEDVQETKKSELTYPYHINRNVTLAILKIHVHLIFQQKELEKTLIKLEKYFQSHKQPIRTGRSFPRKKANNRKRNRFALSTNLKRAI